MKPIDLALALDKLLWLTTDQYAKLVQWAAEHATELGEDESPLGRGTSGM